MLNDTLFKSHDFRLVFLSYPYCLQNTSKTHKTKTVGTKKLLKAKTCPLKRNKGGNEERKENGNIGMCV